MSYPAKYQLLSKENSKRLNVVVSIEGLSTVFSLVPVYEKIRYGDPRIKYGQAGLVYGGLILHPDFKTLLMKEGLTISQKVEPEQARGSVSTISLAFLDKDAYMTGLCSPGVVLDEPLGNKLVTVFMGYQNSNYPDDYVRVFRGYISNTTLIPGKVTLELSDANIKNRQTVFIGGKNFLSAGIDAAQTNIPVAITSGFFAPVIAPDGSYDWQLQVSGSLDLTKVVRAYIKVDDEWMEYRYNGIAPTAFTVFRGGNHSNGTTPVVHSSGAPVANGFQLYGNAIDLILKIFLSGYGGPWITGVSCVALGTTLDVGSPNNKSILFNVDVVEEYGLTPGDKITISGSTAGNNGDYFIALISDANGDSNRAVILTTALVLENPATSVSLAFRSQYDTLPAVCGVKNTPRDIDVASFQAAREIFFSAGQYTMSLFMGDQTEAKAFVEKELFLPIGAYSITRNGRLSIAITKPPFADQKLLQIDETNTINPETLAVTRALNTRRFFNLVQYNYDVQNDGGTFSTTDNYYDTVSATKINITKILPIASLGLRSSNGGALVSSSRGLFLLNRFKKAAYELKLKVNWKVGSLIEIGDMVMVSDPGTKGTLQIPNLETGKRGVGKALFEVIGRSLRIADGYAELTLLSSLGYTIEQRYATVSPSSQVIASTLNSTTQAKITDSYGALYPGNEKRKWENYVGLPVRVHSWDYTREGMVTLLGFSATDPYLMLFDPATPLGFTPQAGDEIDIDEYGTGTVATVNEGYKKSFAFVTPSLTVVAGISQTQFTVSSGDAALLNVGLPILIHDATWITVSIECNILSVVGTTVTVAKALGFTPSAGQKIELVGFKDGGGPYRLL